MTYKKSWKWLTWSRRSSSLQEQPITWAAVYQSSGFSICPAPDVRSSPSAADSCTHVELHSGLNASSSVACSHHSLSPLAQATSAGPALAGSASRQAGGQFLPSEVVCSQDGSQRARELATLPGWSTQRCASAVTQPLLVQEPARVFTPPLHQVAMYHAALLVSRVGRRKHNVQQSVECH